jgi:hypothetical protein
MENVRQGFEAGEISADIRLTEQGILRCRHQRVYLVEDGEKPIVLGDGFTEDPETKTFN